MTKIVFADSEPHIRQLCLEELQDEGYEVQVAGKGREAVSLAGILSARRGHPGGLVAGYVRFGDRPHHQGQPQGNPGDPLFLLPSLPMIYLLGGR